MLTKQSQLRCFVPPLALAASLGALGASARALSPWNLGERLQVLGASAASQPLAQPGVFPAISAEALDKTFITLPAQLEGQRNLLLLSWARDQSSQLDTWTAVAQALQHTQPDFRVYRMPVSAPENMLYQWWDNASMRAAETDPELLHWTVPIYTDKAKLHQALGALSDEHSILVLLVDRSGRILWKAQGTSTAATRASLLALIASVENRH